MLGLEVGVTGALRLPLLNNDRTVFNHLILEKNLDFQEFGTVRSSEEILLDVSRGIDGEEVRYRSRLQSRLVMICFTGLVVL